MIIIRNAEITDSTDVLEWKNDSLSSYMSVISKKIDSREHDKWFKSSLNNPLRTLYIGIISDKKIGICRFDYDKIAISSEVSINLNPQMRGQNLSYNFLVYSIQKYRKTNKYSLTAVIKKENKISINLFKKCGFNLTSENEIFYFFILKNHE